MSYQPASPKAFTLIELLIVVAIIAILAAIAVPNFLEAQTRAKISRVKGELRSFATALESYRIDSNKYPQSLPGAQGEELVVLTTPVAYMTSIPRDTFKLQLRKAPPNSFDGFIYDYVLSKWMTNLPKGSDAPGLTSGNTPFYDCFRVSTPVNQFHGSYDYMMFSIGPDLDEEYFYLNTGNGTPQPRTFLRRSYDATNGTISSGDIYYSNTQMH